MSRGGAVEVLSWAVEHWDRFRSRAEEEQGAFNTPKLPVIGFLLKYVASAVNGYRGDTEKPATTGHDQLAMFKLNKAGKA